MDNSLYEKIVPLPNGKWQVQSKKGRNLGTCDTKEEAEERLKEVEMFKHMDEDIGFDDVSLSPEMIRNTGQEIVFSLSLAEIVALIDTIKNQHCGIEQKLEDMFLDDSKQKFIVIEFSNVYGKPLLDYKIRLSGLFSDALLARYCNRENEPGTYFRPYLDTNCIPIRPNLAEAIDRLYGWDFTDNFNKSTLQNNKTTTEDLDLDVVDVPEYNADYLVKRHGDFDGAEAIQAYADEPLWRVFIVSKLLNTVVASSKVETFREAYKYFINFNLNGSGNYVARLCFIDSIWHRAVLVKGADNNPITEDLELDVIDNANIKKSEAHSRYGFSEYRIEDQEIKEKLTEANPHLSKFLNDDCTWYLIVWKKGLENNNYQGYLNIYSHGIRVHGNYDFGYRPEPDLIKNIVDNSIEEDLELETIPYDDSWKKYYVCDNSFGIPLAETENEILEHGDEYCWYLYYEPYGDLNIYRDGYYGEFDDDKYNGLMTFEEAYNKFLTFPLKEKDTISLFYYRDTDNEHIHTYILEKTQELREELDLDVVDVPYDEKYIVERPDMDAVEMIREHADESIWRVVILDADLVFIKASSEVDIFSNIYEKFINLNLTDHSIAAIAFMDVRGGGWSIVMKKDSDNNPITEDLDLDISDEQNIFEVYWTECKLDDVDEILAEGYNIYITPTGKYGYVKQDDIIDFDEEDFHEITRYIRNNCITVWRYSIPYLNPGTGFEPDIRYRAIIRLPYEDTTEEQKNSIKNLKIKLSSLHYEFQIDKNQNRVFEDLDLEIDSGEPTRRVPDGDFENTRIIGEGLKSKIINLLSNIDDIVDLPKYLPQMQEYKANLEEYIDFLNENFGELWFFTQIKPDDFGENQFNNQLWVAPNLYRHSELFSHCTVAGDLKQLIMDEPYIDGPSKQSQEEVQEDLDFEDADIDNAVVQDILKEFLRNMNQPVFEIGNVLFTGTMAYTHGNVLIRDVAYEIQDGKVTFYYPETASNDAEEAQLMTDVADAARNKNEDPQELLDTYYESTTMDYEKALLEIGMLWGYSKEEIENDLLSKI